MKIILFIYGLLLFQTDETALEVRATSYYIKGKTATGLTTTEIDEPFIAVSRNLLKKFPLGSSVKVSNCKWEGSYKVLDKMGRKPYNMIDVFSNKKNTGIVKCNCKISKVDKK